MTIKRIHITSSGPRCGTTLLFEAMKTCFQFDGAPEHEAPICQSRYDFARGGVVLTKHPAECDLVRWPLRLDPGLVVICIIRDPRDMVVSTHSGRPGTYWASLRYWQLFLEHIGKLEVERRFVLIRYEDLVADPDGLQERICRCFPMLNKRYFFCDFHLHARPSNKALDALNGMRPIKADGVGSWKNHLPRIKQQISIHGSISSSLVRFGYEPDDLWELNLKDVTTADFETATGEVFGKHFNFRRRRRNMIGIARSVIDKTGLQSQKIFSPMRLALRHLRRRR